jgi:hypothetical protein
VTVDPNKLVSQADPIGNEMGAPESFGALRLSAVANGTDLFAFSRIYRTRAEGGTWGFARNGVTPAQALSAGDSGFFFAAPDPAVQRTNGGLVVVESSTGTISIVDPDGATRVSYFYDWPQGYRIQGSTVFASLGVNPIGSARIVVSPATGKVLVFGVSNDNVTNDPTGLDVFGPKSAATAQRLAGVARAGGPMGATSRTDVQLYNPGTAAATVTLAFHAAQPDGSTAPTPGVPMTTVTVAGGKVVTLADVLALLGVDRTAGTLDVLCPDQPVVAFARVRANAASGGTFGYGTPGQQASDAIAAGSRGVFLAATDNGYDVMQSDLHLTNLSDQPADVTLNLTDADGTAAGTRTVTLPPGETRFIASVWYSIAGSSTDFGRVDVVPADGAGPVLATLLRQDRMSGDVDALLPQVLPK